MLVITNNVINYIPVKGAHAKCVLMHVQVYNKLIKTTQTERSTVKVLQTQVRFYMNPNLLNIHPI